MRSSSLHFVSSILCLPAMAASEQTVFIILNTTWNLVNFRSGLIKALLTSGYRVVAVAPPDSHIPRLLALGCDYEPLSMDSGGTNPLKDLLLTWRFYRLIRKYRPVAFLPYTAKPNIYGSLAANLAGVPVINNIAGLGSAFLRGGWLVKVLQGLYRLALARSQRIFFQNRDDQELFIDQALVRREQTALLPGSGIDLQRFQPRPKPAGAVAFRFLFLSRMLKDKGALEFVAAARQLHTRYPEVEFVMLGFLDVENPSAVSREQMQQWQAEGIIHYHGEAEDVRDHIAAADCIVLPSYREGTPRTLLEAAAMARPMITTDAVGCREVIEDGINGYACRIADADDLAAKMERLLQLSPDQRQNLGDNGRRKVEQQFDEQIVIQSYLSALNLAIQTR